MNILSFPLGQLQANCYFAIEGSACVIIDPADDASFILEEVQRRKLHPVALFATHGHFDHVMAAGEIQLSFDIPLYIGDRDMFLIKRLDETAERFLGYKPTIVAPKYIIFLKQRKLEIKGLKFEIVYTPGHTPGSVCFYFKNKGVLFTGDTVFKEGIGRYDHSYSSRKDVRNSLKKIVKLPKETIMYPGHGEKTSVENERKALQLIVDVILSHVSH